MPDRWFDGTYYKREITLNYYECNTERKVFVHSILGLFSEIAGDESQAKGHTHSYFVNFGRVFLITRMSIRFHRTPMVNETLIFRTWFRTVEGKFFFRDCDVRSPDGELIASISGTWVLIDLVEHKVLTLGDHRVVDVRAFDEGADSPECKKITPIEPLPVIGLRPVYYTDLDCNYHLNNTVYTKIAVDFLPPAYQGLEVRDYVVNFNKETKLGDMLEIRGGITEGGYIIQGYCENALHFGCEFIFAD